MSTKTHDNQRLQYIDFALSYGLQHAIGIEVSQIAFDNRTYLKCMFGCGGSRPGTLCHSQPGRIKPWEYEPMLRRYAWGILLHANDNRLVQKAALSLEGKAFHDGYYFAFSLSDCDLCGDCARWKGKPCAHETDVRPSMHGAGIDVFKTVRALGLPIEVLQDEKAVQNCYALVLIE